MVSLIQDQTDCFVLLMQLQNHDQMKNIYVGIKFHPTMRSMK
ncbi:hypothetical protein MCY_01067 [Bartonella rattimassiliensis 15908]|uniref:Uncharacterized protein n=1 Tax=Bartonella rattimassiliensis 15908 TaxID=1094556 RepID=J0QIZ5_9HYPH|nr:hypothetical protein MCY_01067 [Bartonella rattimassiliensis 15908]